MAAITVATWNMHQQRKSWAYLDRLRDDHGVQVALVQEAVPPAEPGRWPSITPDPSDASLWKIAIPPRVKNRNYASAIVLLDDRLTFTPDPATPLADADYYDSLAASHPGQFAVARVRLPGATQELVLVSLYGVWHTPSGNGAEATLHRALSDLTPLFLADAPIVLAGDLNLFRNTDNPGQLHFDTVFTRLDAYGLPLRGPYRPSGVPPLDGCVCGQGERCDHVETYRIFRTNAKTNPYQDDYVFASRALNVTSCAAVTDPVIREQRCSDHWPVVAQVDLA